MSGVNKVILIGYLGRDPEVKHLEGGNTVASFSLATTESYKDKAGKRVEKTEWNNIVVWRNLAEVAERYLSKGKRIYLEGKIRTRSYDDKEGIKKYFTEIVADTFTMLDSKSDKESVGQMSVSESNASDTESSEAFEDDLPF